MEQKIPTWAQAYAARSPNALEKRIAEQKAGHLPEWQLNWAISKLPSTDPRRQAVIAAELAGEEVNFDAIFKQ